MALESTQVAYLVGVALMFAFTGMLFAYRRQIAEWIIRNSPGGRPRPPSHPLPANDGFVVLRRGRAAEGAAGDETRPGKMTVRETIDATFVRARSSMTYVSSPGALAAFSAGTGIFDVDPHCRNLDAFVAEHKLEAMIDIDSELLLPCANPMGEKRPVYYGRARWRKRSPIGPDKVA